MSAVPCAVYATCGSPPPHFTCSANSDAFHVAPPSVEE